MEAVAFFQAVPAELWWDNPATVAVRASHYRLAPKSCRPAAPQEKPRVEGRVKVLERMWATPVPAVADLAALNAHLRRCCPAARERTCGGNADTVGERFARDRAAAVSRRPARSTPTSCSPGRWTSSRRCGSTGTRTACPAGGRSGGEREGFIDRVELVADGRLVATHPRSYARHERVLAPDTSWYSWTPNQLAREAAARDEPYHAYLSWPAGSGWPPGGTAAGSAAAGPAKRTWRRPSGCDCAGRASGCGS